MVIKMPDYCEFTKDCKSGAVSQAQAARTKKLYSKVVCISCEPEAMAEAEAAAAEADAQAQWEAEH